MCKGLSFTLCSCSSPWDVQGSAYNRVCRNKSRCRLAVQDTLEPLGGVMGLVPVSRLWRGAQTRVVGAGVIQDNQRWAGYFPGLEYRYWGWVISVLGLGDIGTGAGEYRHGGWGIPVRGLGNTGTGAGKYGYGPGEYRYGAGEFWYGAGEYWHGGWEDRHGGWGIPVLGLGNNGTGLGNTRMGLGNTGTGTGPGNIGTGLGNTGTGLGNTGMGLGSTGTGLGNTGAIISNPVSTSSECWRCRLGVSVPGQKHRKAPPYGGRLPIRPFGLS